MHIQASTKTRAKAVRKKKAAKTAAPLTPLHTTPLHGGGGWEGDGEGGGGGGGGGKFVSPHDGNSGGCVQVDDLEKKDSDPVESPSTALGVCVCVRGCGVLVGMGVVCVFVCMHM